jgi:tRNA 5-methylaminomethyl-2-thiouridine biosynthesis bifunctional protein
VQRSADTDEADGLTRARHLFLRGCGLLDGDAAPWTDKPAWHILETAFGQGLNFLAAWHAWRNTHRRPGLLHFSSVQERAVSADDIRNSAASFPEVAELASQLAEQWRGMLPGVHRLVLDGGLVQLTLHIGPALEVLPTLDATVDSVFLDDADSGANPDMWSAPLAKAVARLCRPGTQLASGWVARGVKNQLVSAGFELAGTQDQPSERIQLRACYAPRWSARAVTRQPHAATSNSETAVVVGGGLAGSAVAYSLAKRGWRVTVLDRAEQPASGASALPAGMVAPHVSPDDALLSRLSRSGVRLTLHRARQLLECGTDWAPTGVLEHRVEGKRGLPRNETWLQWGAEWSVEASPQQCQAAHLPDNASALWHVNAGWIRPAQLVCAQLRHPRIRWQGGCHVAALQRLERGWRLLSAKGDVLAEADHVVLAAAWPTLGLLQGFGEHGLPLHPLRGQISWGNMASLPVAAQALLPPFPVNGHGALAHGMVGPDGEPGWFVGSTFDRGITEAILRPQDRQTNLVKLQGLLPELAQVMAPAFNQAHDWAGVRCTLPDRFPAVGPLAPQRLPGLHICTGLGARGLTLSVLCGELLGALLHGEPWPTERKLAQALLAERFERKTAQSP